MSVRRHERDDRGAAAVEFALVVPILLMLLFGMIDYGLYFSDSLAARQGVQQGAREGVVGNVSAGDCTGYSVSGNSDLRRLACLTLDRVDAVGGSSYARVHTPDDWDEGEELLVCVVVASRSLTGLTPLPRDGNVYSQVEMRIETQNVPSRDGTGFARDDGAPTIPPSDWDWCA